jgi:hypothetical protein
VTDGVGVVAAVAIVPAIAAPATNASAVVRFFFIGDILPELPEIFLL